MAPRPSGRSAAVVTLVLALVLGSCTRTSGSDNDDPAADTWASRTAAVLADGLQEAPDGPVPQIATPIPTTHPLFDRAGAELALTSAGQLDHPSSETDDDLADAIEPTGVVDDGISPTEVLTWYVARLGAAPGDPAPSVRRRVDEVADALDATIESHLTAPSDDPFTQVFWARAAVARQRGAAVRIAGLDPTPACESSARAGTEQVEAALALAGAASEIATAAGTPCPRAVIDRWQTLQGPAEDWLRRAARGDELDATDVGALAAIARLGRAGVFNDDLAAAATDRLASGLADDEVERTPAVVLEAVDALEAASEAPVLGPETAATLRAVLEGSTEVIPAATALRVLQWADTLRRLGASGRAAIEKITDWSDPALDPLDRLVLAVAAQSTEHLDLEVFEQADPGPTTFALALRAAALAGEACPDSVDQLVERTIREIEDRGASTASNPYTASGYAAFVVLAEQCDQTGPAIDEVERTVRSHLRALRRDDGLFGTAESGVDLRLTAALLLANCRLDDPAGLPRTDAVEEATIGIRLDGGGAATDSSTALSLDDTLAVAQIDAAASRGCGVLRP